MLCNNTVVVCVVVYVVLITSVLIQSLGIWPSINIRFLHKLQITTNKQRCSINNEILNFEEKSKIISMSNYIKLCQGLSRPSILYILYLGYSIFLQIWLDKLLSGFKGETFRHIHIRRKIYESSRQEIGSMLISG